MKSLVNLLALALMALLLSACDLNREEKEDAMSEQQAINEAMAMAKSQSMNEAAVEVFRPTDSEAAFLNFRAAANRLGMTNGYYTNQKGITGYFSNYDQPFNFIWTGETIETTALDGYRYNIMNGYGELIVKYMGDDLIIQRYKGEMKEGLWHGHGEYLVRNEDGPANSSSYVGGFSYDEMEGRGVYTDYDFYINGAHPSRYEGEFNRGYFHGQGMETDLATGEVGYKGLWYMGSPTYGSKDQWKRQNDFDELNEVYRQYFGLIQVGSAVLTGYINEEPGKGFLTVITPEEAKNVEIVDVAANRPFTAGLMLHPARKTPEGDDLYVFGSVSELPASAYPLTLVISYDRAGVREAVRLSVKRPFTIEVQ